MSDDQIVDEGSHRSEASAAERSIRSRLVMKLPGRNRELLRRYGLALALAGIALSIRAVLPVLEGTTIYQLPLAAVILSAWSGGRGPGLFATLICATGILYWFIPPANTFDMPPDYVIGFCIFIALCLILSEFGAARRRAAHALEESERSFRLMAETIPEILWIESIAPRKMLYMSPRYEHIWGRPVRDLGPEPEAWMEAIHTEDRDNVRSAWTRWLADPTTRRLEATFRIVRPDGQTRWIHSRASLVRDKYGRPYRVSGIAEDVTAEKRAQEALAKAQTELAHVSRLTMLGELTASIAHEVSQPVGAIIARAGACARWLCAEPPDVAEARTVLDNIVADGKRAREVIGRIRTLAKRQAPHKDSLDINQEILEVIALTEHELRSNGVVCRTQLERALPRVAGDHVQLQQVILNLIMNAIEAMSGVGDRLRELVIVSGRDGSDGVVIQVRDSGTGLDSEGAERVFEAFYTTKAEGLGIGLSISRTIVNAHGGRLWVRPNEPHGAVFGFSLPAAERGR